MDLARTETVTPQMERIDLSRLVAGEALPFESVAFEKGLVLHTDIASGIHMDGNSTQLKQLTSILLDNGTRHSASGGEVRLTLTREHGMAQLCVINTGDEIPPEHREKIFERFYRMDPARNGEDKHYGLGLAIAKAIVSAHHGQIGVLCITVWWSFGQHSPWRRKRKRSVTSIKLQASSCIMIASRYRRYTLTTSKQHCRIAGSAASPYPSNDIMGIVLMDQIHTVEVQENNIRIPA